MNTIDIILIIAIAIVVGLALKSTIKRHKNGGCSCGGSSGCDGNCAGCKGCSK